MSFPISSPDHLPHGLRMLQRGAGTVILPVAHPRGVEATPSSSFAVTGIDLIHPASQLPVPGSQGPGKALG